jgi:hypothetical protein
MEMQNKEDQFEIKAKKHNNPMVFSSISEEEERHYIVMPMRSE